ncbi:MAG: hypothetical protein HY644_12175 [Acidobacteria bacterium]|nr:hypothetical protein [Acidobacteriota bacterium]
MRKKSSIHVVCLIVLFIGAFLAQAYAQQAQRTGEITKIDTAKKSFMLKTSRGEANILTTVATVFKEGDKKIKLGSLKVGDNVKVTGERKGNDVQAKEVVKEAAFHGHDHE